MEECIYHRLSPSGSKPGGRDECTGCLLKRAFKINTCGKEVKEAGPDRKKVKLQGQPQNSFGQHMMRSKQEVMLILMGQGGEAFIPMHPSVIGYEIPWEGT